MGNLPALIVSLFLAGSLHIGGPAFVVVGDTVADDSTAAVERVFGDVHGGMLENAVEGFSAHFSPHVFIQLPGSEGGIFSARQAFFVLDHFLKDHNVIAATLTPSERSGLNPYASGNATIVARGTRQEVRLYVVLAWDGERWTITHFSIQ
jgi:hypothetical protein